jgi:hypothetical protein
MFLSCPATNAGPLDAAGDPINDDDNRPAVVRRSLASCLDSIFLKHGMQLSFVDHMGVRNQSVNADGTIVVAPLDDDNGEQGQPL